MSSLDPRTAGFWMVVWLLGLVLLAVVPPRTPDTGLADGGLPKVYDSQGMTSSVHRNLTGADTIRVGALQPAVPD